VRALRSISNKALAFGASLPFGLAEAAFYALAFYSGFFAAAAAF